jgi:hypothetical protein
MSRSTRIPTISRSAGVAAGGVLSGCYLFFLVEFSMEYSRVFFQIAVFGLVFGVPITYFFMAGERLKASEQQIREEKIRRLKMEKEAAMTSLRLLQAQIEPHFLFNTLSNVLSLMDTDVENGTGAGLVAMVEVVALMIGRIVQCYSPERYDPVIPLQNGLFLKKGQPKSLFRPGSSTVVLIFENNRIQFCRDLVENARRYDVKTRFSAHFGTPLVETDIQVRETIAKAF